MLFSSRNRLNARSGKRWCFYRLSVFYLFSACLNVLFAFVYDHHMDIGWETLAFPHMVCFLILPSWAMISALFDRFVSRNPRHQFLSSPIFTVTFLGTTKTPATSPVARVGLHAQKFHYI